MRQNNSRRRLRRPRILRELGAHNEVDVALRERKQSGDVEPVPRRSKRRQILFRQAKQSHRRPETAAMLRMARMFELFLKMHEGTGRLDQPLEIIRIAGRGPEPKMFEHVVRFVVALFIPATEEAAITRMPLDVAYGALRIARLQLLDKARNPLAFSHAGGSLLPSEMRGKPARVNFRRAKYTQESRCCA